MQDIEGLVAVSKRCCPACNKLVELLQDTGGAFRNIIYPGNHTTWSSVALPPWLPAHFADRVKAYVDDELAKRLERLVEMLDEERNKRARTASFGTVAEEQLEPDITEEKEKDPHVHARGKGGSRRADECNSTLASMCAVVLSNLPLTHHLSILCNGDGPSYDTTRLQLLPCHTSSSACAPRASMPFTDSQPLTLRRGHPRGGELSSQQQQPNRVVIGDVEITGGTVHFIHIHFGLVLR